MASNRMGLAVHRETRKAGRMIRIVAAALAWIVLVAIVPGARAERESRVALVIGNGAYQHLPRLDNPANDAKLIADTLNGLGFTLIGGGAQTDLDRMSFEKAIREFGAALAGGSVGLFYYAGHGLQMQGANYLVPVGANPTNSADVDFEMIDAGLVLKQMEASGSKLNFVILDACRNNPFGGRGLRDSGGGLAQMQAPTGTLISYATQPGHVALDGSNGHSPYTAALAEALKKPGLRVLDVFNQVGLSVDQKTMHRQQPWQSSSPINGDFYFIGPTTVTITNPDSGKDVLYWESIKASGDPADFEDFLKRYPQSDFATLAQRRIAALRAPAPAVAPPSVSREPTPSGDGEASWSLEQRREVQRSLHALGHYQGEADGGFGAGTRAAIKEFQSYEGDPETGTLTADEHRKLLDMSQRLAVLLDLPSVSPEGVTAISVKGDARYARGWSAENGKSAKQDPAEAAYWYGLAGVDGDAKALTNLGTLMARGQGVGGADRSNAMLLWHAAAARGDAVAMYNLGVLYERGIGVTADLAKAKAWYTRAALHNHADARAALKRLGA